MLRAGVLGCGNIGRTHTEIVNDLDGIEMVGFCDVIEGTAAQLCSEFDGDYVTTEPTRIFNDESIDVVYICTRHDTHAEFCVQAAERGKDILVEKPLALSSEETTEVCRAVERSDVTLMMGFKMRYFDLVRKARELIPNPISITMQMMDDPWGSESWTNDPEVGGGNVISQGVHSCDVMRYLANEDPTLVHAVGGNFYQDTGVIDNVFATFQFENDVAGNLVQGDANCPSFTSKFFLQLFDEGRSVTLSDRFCRLTYKETGEDPIVYGGNETGFRGENEAFLQALNDGDPTPIDQFDGHMATKMIEGCFESIKTDRAVPIDTTSP